MENKNQQEVKSFNPEEGVTETENEKINEMKELEGQEVWTNAFGDRFGERVCVGIEDEKCLHNGEKFTPTKKEIKELWNDYVFQELGSNSQIQRELEEEFGGAK